MKNLHKMPSREQKRAIFNMVFKTIKAMAVPVAKIQRSRRRKKYAGRIKMSIAGTDECCIWPNEEIFFFGGCGLMSIFEVINKYSDDSYDDVWHIACKKLIRLACFSECRSVEELMIVMAITGEELAYE